MAEHAEKRRDRGDDGISWDITNRCYVGTLSLGIDPSGKRLRRTVTRQDESAGQRQARQVTRRDQGRKSPLPGHLHGGAVRPRLARLAHDRLRDDCPVPGAGREMDLSEDRKGQAQARLSAKDVERFFNDCGRVLSKRSLVGAQEHAPPIYPPRATLHDLIGRTVADLVDLPEGQPGRPSRAMTRAAGGQGSPARPPVSRSVTSPSSRSATTARQPPTPRPKPISSPAPPGPARTAPSNTSAPIWPTPPAHHCRSQLGLDGTSASDGPAGGAVRPGHHPGLRPGELRALTWDHVHLDQGIIHVWRSARKGGDTKTPQSRRSLMLPKRAIDALTAHKKRQAAERLVAGEAWQDHNLVFCHENGAQYTRDALN